MELSALVAKYKQLAGGFGKPVPLAAFGQSREETERVFGLLDEDYHISRFFHFSLDPATQAGGPPIVAYQINGFAHTHISIDAEVETIL
jgi:hypothetical protein